MNIQKQVNIIRRRQQQLIREVRIASAAYMFPYLHGRLLSIGEGVTWQSTFIAFCIHLQLLPMELIESITILDDHAWPGSLICNPSLKGIQPLNPVVADANHKPFDSETFQASFAPFMLGHCTNHSNILNELMRCTKRNGLIMISDHGLDIPRYSSKVAAQLLGGNHTKNVDFEWLSDFAYTSGLQEVFRLFNEHAWTIIFRKID